MSAQTVNAFLKQYLEDQWSCRRRTLDQYIEIFPGADEAIGEHYARLESEASDRSALASPTGRIGRYRVLGELGRGGQGVVYLAEDDSLHRTVALKVLTALGSLAPSRVARFLREAEVASRLDHPGIATVYEIGTDGGVPFIAMRFVEGETLAAHISRESAAGDRDAVEAVKRAAAIAEKAARALHLAHELGIVHRDVKPGNILIQKDGNPVIVDFGLAHDSDSDLATLTRTGDFLGTPAYMSPEQIGTNAPKPDRRTDVWSLGAVLYECLTLRRPFDAPTREGLYLAIMTRAIPDPRELNDAVSGDLKVVIETALEKDRDRRYQTALDFAEDLRRIRMHESILAKPASRFVHVQRWARRNPALAASLCGLIMVLVAGLAVTLFLLASSERERLAKEKALDDYDRLGDFSRLRGLVAGADRLWPADPGKVAAMKLWLEQASHLEKRLAGHKEVRDRLRLSAALPHDAEETGAASRKADERESPAERLNWNFESSAEQFKHDTTASLVADLTAFVDPDPRKGLLAEVRRRTAFAESVERETIGKYETQWAEAVRSIADPHACPKYHGLAIKPQLGLIPIGRDPGSGLWEFAHLQTTAPGTDPMPKRNPQGRLVVTESTGLVFVLIPGGTFRMGATQADEDSSPTEPNVDPEALKNESPVTDVALDPFFMSKYEMTQGQWQMVVGKNPSSYVAGSTVGTETLSLLNPVEQVSWDDCDSVLGRLGLILPTEAQWEYAARGGTTTPRWTGPGKDGLDKAANLADLVFHSRSGFSTQPYESWEDGYTLHAPVGAFGANPFGLHDVLGNVWEWCRDGNANYGAAPDPGDGQRHPAILRFRSLRGGSFFYDASPARATYRGLNTADFRSNLIGVRPARRLDR